MGNLQTNSVIQSEINDDFVAAASNYIQNSDKFVSNTNFKFVVLILITEIKGVPHAVFHHHGREDALGFIAGKVDPIVVCDLSDLGGSCITTLEKTHTAMWREAYEEAGFVFTCADHKLDTHICPNICEIEICAELVQKTTYVFVAKTTQPDSLDLTLWRKVCLGDETKNIVAIPMSTVKSWKPETGKPLICENNISYIPRKYSVATFIDLIDLWDRNIF